MTNTTMSALARAESFVAGFVDDESQEGIDEILAELRSAQAIERSAAPIEALQALDAESWLDSDPSDTGGLSSAKAQARAALSVDAPSPLHGDKAQGGLSAAVSASIIDALRISRQFVQVAASTTDDALMRTAVNNDLAKIDAAIAAGEAELSR